jgi:hypothetical protein
MVHQMLIVNIVQMRTGRHFDVGDAAWAQDPVNLPKRFFISIDMLKHVEESDSINTVVRQRTFAEIELQNRQVRHPFNEAHKGRSNVVRADQGRLG